MLAGNIGIVTMVSTLLLSFMQLSEADEKVNYAASMCLGLLFLIVLMRSNRINDFVVGIIAKALRRWVVAETVNYHKIMKLERGYAINEFVVKAENWLAGRTLADTRIADEGIIVLVFTARMVTTQGLPAVRCPFMPMTRLSSTAKTRFAWNCPVADRASRAIGPMPKLLPN